jgi:hypothetical protein
MFAAGGWFKLLNKMFHVEHFDFFNATPYMTFLN